MQVHAPAVGNVAEVFDQMHKQGCDELQQGYGLWKGRRSRISHIFVFYKKGEIMAMFEEITNDIDGATTEKRLMLKTWDSHEMAMEYLKRWDVFLGEKGSLIVCHEA